MLFMLFMLFRLNDHPAKSTHRVDATTSEKSLPVNLLVRKSGVPLLGQNKGRRPFWTNEKGVCTPLRSKVKMGVPLLGSCTVFFVHSPHNSGA